mmetsp:Transcript_178573/g.572397  ORF Transcript_178573/g.572397 Transcript_178573/m.572397 type:complete len:211 (+) Transcript_178573:215-847(+)
MNWHPFSKRRSKMANSSGGSASGSRVPICSPPHFSLNASTMFEKSFSTPLSRHRCIVVLGEVTSSGSQCRSCRLLGSSTLSDFVQSQPKTSNFPLSIPSGAQRTPSRSPQNPHQGNRTKPRALNFSPCAVSTSPMRGFAPSGTLPGSVASSDAYTSKPPGTSTCHKRYTMSVPNVSEARRRDSTTRTDLGPMVGCTTRSVSAVPNGTPRM